MKNIQAIKYSTDEKHTKLLNFMRAWAKRKQDRQEQVWEDYEERLYFHRWSLFLTMKMR